MTAETEEDRPVPARITTAQASWWKAVGIYLAIVVPVGVLAGFVIWIPMLAGCSLVLVAVPYTVFVTIKLVRGRKAAAAAVGEEVAATESPFADPAARFGTLSQRLSLINAGTLGVAAAVAIVGANTGNTSLVPYISLVLLAMLSVLEIVVNAPWIYSKQTARAEAHAIRHRSRARAIILVNRRLSWVIWYVGALASVVIVVGYINLSHAVEEFSVY